MMGVGGGKVRGRAGRRLCAGTVAHLDMAVKLPAVFEAVGRIGRSDGVRWAVVG